MLSLLPFSVGAFAQSATQLFDQAVEVQKNGKLSQASSLYTQSYDAFVCEGKEDSAEAAQCLHNLSKVYCMQRMMDQSRKYGQMALELREKIFGKVSPEYVTTLNIYANTYHTKDMQRSLEIQKEVIQLMEQLSVPHPFAGTYYTNLALYYFNLHDNEGSIENFEKALANTEKYSDEYLWLLQMLGDLYITLDRSDDLYRIMALVDENNQHELLKECNDPQCMLQRAEYYMVNGDNGNVQECFNALRAMALDDEMTAKTYDLYGAFISDTDPEVGAESYITSANAFKKMKGRTYDYGRTLYMAGLSYGKARDFEKANQQLKQAMDVFSSISSESEEAMEKLLSCKKELAGNYNFLGIQNETDSDYAMAVNHPQAEDLWALYYQTSLRKALVWDQVGLPTLPAIWSYSLSIGVIGCPGR